MRLFDWFRAASPAPGQPRADIGTAVETWSLNDPRLEMFLRGGNLAVTGQAISVAQSLRNPAMFRAVALISNAIGMLPLHLIDAETKARAADHPLFRLLHRRPNGWQTAFDFRAHMQFRALDGDAYALIVRSRNVRTGRKEVSRLVPLDPACMTPKLGADWTLRYEYQPPQGGKRTLQPEDVFHLRGLSFDGLRGVSLIRQARDSIAVALAAQLATGRQFKNGSFVGGALKHPARISAEAYQRLRESLAEKEGAENAGKSLILEENMTWERYASTARDAQLVDLRKLEVEEIARVTGVPRPLLMVDETSWGSGIEALGQFFVAYALNPWFEAWQQALERSLLNDDEQGRFAVKFNPAALLRGSLKDQADFLAKALGAGGHAPWMHVDEVRDVMDLPEREAPPHAMAGHPAADDADDADGETKPRKPDEDENDED